MLAREHFELQPQTTNCKVCQIASRSAPQVSLELDSISRTNVDPGPWTPDPGPCHRGGGGGVGPIWPTTGLQERSGTAQHLHVSALVHSIAAMDNELQNVVYLLWMCTSREHSAMDGVCGTNMFCQNPATKGGG